ncbi:protein-tyrosine phosphatase-like protein [Sordaria sp. MPI-SDFR-AT-0083]|nr:protein-tyrosine phosphatase-like protein [Sordaria sp. MPI-SDFR-AT-0083]
MSPPPPAPPIGHGSSSEHHEIKRRKSSPSTRSRSSTPSAAAPSVPSISVPAPTYPSDHRSSSFSHQPLPFQHRRSPSGTSDHRSSSFSHQPLPFQHRRSPSGTSDHRSPSPGSSSTPFVLPPGVSISQITPNVFVGNNASSTSIQTLMHYGITSMVSLLSTAEQQLNEEAWNSPALEMLVPKQNRLFVRCDDSPEEDLVGRLGMICEFVQAQVEGHGGGFEGGLEVPGGGQRRRKPSVEDVLKDVLPASELPKGFNTGQEPPKPKQRVRSLIPDADGNVEGLPPKQPAAAKGAEDMAELTRQKSRRESGSAPAPQKQRVRSLIPDDVESAGGPSTSPKPIPSVPSGSIPSVPSAPVPSLPGPGHQLSSYLPPGSSSTPSQLSALSPSAQAGPSGSLSSLPSPSETTGRKVLIHCNQGVSRSGAACVAYIMKQNPTWSVGKALRFVESRRKEVEPNENFKNQLKVWGECKFDVWQDASLEVDGKSVDGKKKMVPKKPYAKWLKQREELRKRVGEMGGLVSPMGSQA